MKLRTIVFILIILGAIVMRSNEIKYPFIYIPGMFDNGDMMNSDYHLVKNLNNKDGYYYSNYFNKKYNYEKAIIFCSSNIISSRYNRLSVANLIGPYRTNISLYLMSERLFCLIQGRAPKGKNFGSLTNYEGNDYEGYVLIDGVKIRYRGLLEEIWAKYGNKVFYKPNKDGFKIILTTEKEDVSYFVNDDYYFDSPEEIKFNIVAHSSGGLAVRKYLQLCEKEKLSSHINLIVNLSVPQKGARMNFALKSAFPKLIGRALLSFYNNREKGIVEIKDLGITYDYLELIEKSRVEKMIGDSFKAKRLRKVIGNYILYHIPFDGKKGVLGRDQALYDLHPEHKFIKSLKDVEIPRRIRIYNFKVKSPYASMFKYIGEFLKLGQNDGVVDYEDTSLDQLPNFKELDIKNIDVKKANHIPFPYIKPIFELRETIIKFYPFLKIMLKDHLESEKGINIIHALMVGIMKEIGLDIDYFLKHEDYSVIDYFADHPIELDGE